MNPYHEQFLRALALTISIEGGVLILVLRIFRRFGRIEFSWSRSLAAAAIASGLTLPYLWFVAPHYLPDGPIFLWTGEALIYLAEAAFYASFLRLRAWDALILSSLCNTASVLLGFVLSPLLIH